MKTRQEMTYDFMLALAPSWPEFKANLWREDNDDLIDGEAATEIAECAMFLTDAYLETLE